MECANFSSLTSSLCASTGILMCSDALTPTVIIDGSVRESILSTFAIQTMQVPDSGLFIVHLDLFGCMYRGYMLSVEDLLVYWARVFECSHGQIVSVCTDTSQIYRNNPKFKMENIDFYMSRHFWKFSDTHHVFWLQKSKIINGFV